MKLKIANSLLVSAVMAIAGCGRSNNFGHGLVLNDDVSYSTFLLREGRSYGSVVVGAQVVDVIAQNGFLFVLRFVSENYDCWEGKDRVSIQHHTSDGQFWIVEIAGSDVVGPLNQNQFDEHLRRGGIVLHRSLNIGSYMPNTESFEARKALCSRLKPA